MLCTHLMHFMTADIGTFRSDNKIASRNLYHRDLSHVLAGCQTIRKTTRKGSLRRWLSWLWLGWQLGMALAGPMVLALGALAGWWSALFSCAAPSLLRERERGLRGGRFLPESPLSASLCLPFLNSAALSVAIKDIIIVIQLI